MIKFWKKQDGTKIEIATMSVTELQGRIRFLDNNGRDGRVMQSLRSALEKTAAAEVEVPIEVKPSITKPTDLTWKQFAETLGVSISTAKRRVAAASVG